MKSPSEDPMLCAKVLTSGCLTPNRFACSLSRAERQSEAMETAAHFSRETDSLGFSTLAIARWESEGGSDADRAQAGQRAQSFGRTPLLDAELVQLRVRVIALENLVVALLVNAPIHQLFLARQMADFISPRPGCTQHPMTLRAADEMNSLVDRADRFSVVVAYSHPTT
jgi:hypothetical protein